MRELLVALPLPRAEHSLTVTLASSGNLCRRVLTCPPFLSRDNETFSAFCSPRSVAGMGGVGQGRYSYSFTPAFGHSYGAI
jgi:hypothetical protein